MFNAIAYSKKLQDAGVTRQQADAHAESLLEIVESELATKSNLKELESRLTLKICGIIGTWVTILSVVNTIYR